MFRIAVCDNEPADLTRLTAMTRRCLAKHPEMCGSVVGYQSPSDLIEALKIEHFNAYLLDILMPEVDGLQLARKIRSVDDSAPIIYTTSSPEHALQAYGVHALRYLMKPVNSRELTSALLLAFELQNKRPRHTVLIKQPHGSLSVVAEDIMYVENAARTATYTMWDGRQLYSTRNTGTFEELMAPIVAVAPFVQPHKSYFVNMAYIRSIQTGQLVMDDGAEIPLNRKRVMDVRTAYLAYIGQAQREAAVEEQA